MSDQGEAPSATRAYEMIRSAIVEGRYAPGERLVEQRIAEESGLSRTPVREAIRRLAAEGLVVTSPNRGAAVRDMDADEVLDLYGLRIRLESYAAELAAARMNNDEVGALWNAVDRFGEVVAQFDADDLDAVRELNRRNRSIHDLILAGSKHTRLQALLARTVDVPLVFQAFRRFSTDDVARSDLFHRLIATAIEGRQTDRARWLMSEHIEQSLDAVLSKIDPDGRRRGSLEAR